jgi:hypothetical protein
LSTGYPPTRTTRRGLATMRKRYVANDALEKLWAMLRSFSFQRCPLGRLIRTMTPLYRRVRPPWGLNASRAQQGYLL